MNETCSGIFNNETIRFQWIERNYQVDIPMRLNYGTIKNHSNYILGKASFNTKSYVDYGYLLEKIVLKATELGLGSCWIGYFDAVYFPEIIKTKGEYIPSLIIVGNAAPRRKASEKITRYFVKADKRKDWDQLFFSGELNTPLGISAADKYTNALEMLRLAPSSGNSQPWRVIRDKNKNSFHFYRKTVHPHYQKRGLHDVDLGICMAHFEMAAHHDQLDGKWECITGMNKYTAKDMDYISSWIGDKG